MSPLFQPVRFSPILLDDLLVLIQGRTCGDVLIVAGELRGGLLIVALTLYTTAVFFSLHSQRCFPAQAAVTLPSPIASCIPIKDAGGLRRLDHFQTARE